MQFSLRTLLIVMLLGGPLCAWGYLLWQSKAAAKEKRMPEGPLGIVTLEFDPVCELKPGTPPPTASDSGLSPSEMRIQESAEYVPVPGKSTIPTAAEFLERLRTTPDRRSEEF